MRPRAPTTVRCAFRVLAKPNRCEKSGRMTIAEIPLSWFARKIWRKKQTPKIGVVKTCVDKFLYGRLRANHVDFRCMTCFSRFYVYASMIDCFYCFFNTKRSILRSIQNKRDA